MIENGKEVPLPATNSMVRIADVVKVTRNCRVIGLVSLKIVEDVLVGKKEEVPTVDPVSGTTCQSGESSGLKANDDEVLSLIKRSEFNVVEKLLHT